MIDLTRRHELEWLAELVGDLDYAVPGIKSILVGALARDLLLHYGDGVAARA